MKIVTRLTYILIEQFIVNLQHARQAALGSTAMSHSVSLVKFDRVIGSIGELLEQSMDAQDVYLGDEHDPESEQSTDGGPRSSAA